jgi:nucleotide-binding universal stress UspA family protein
MASTEVRSYTSTITEHLLDSSVEEWRIQTVDETFLVAVIDALQAADTAATSVEWLTTSETVKALQNDFLVATKISELTASERLSIRTSTDDAALSPTVLLGDGIAISLIPLGDMEAVETVTTHETATKRLWDVYETAWERAIPEPIDTPPYSRLLSLAESHLGEAARADIDMAYADIESHTPTSQPEPVMVGLLVGAKQELLLRDVVEWAETSTLATQGTVSKLKQQLEDAGAIATESENIGVGRPRQRLILAADDLVGLDADALVATVQDDLA